MTRCIIPLLGVFTLLLAACTSGMHSPAASAPALPEDQIRWPLNNLESIAGFPATRLGAPKLSPSGISFNGVNDGLVLQTAPLAGMKAFTFEVLFKPESGGPAEQRFIHSEDQAGNRMTVETRLTPDGRWSLDTFLLAGPSRRSLYDAARLHPADQWYWAALRYDGATMCHFVNGIKELEGPVSFPPMGPGRISIGVRLNQVGWFKGQIREIRITPRALPDSQLQANPG